MPLSNDTIECCRQLLAFAEAGRLVGLTVAAQFALRAYDVQVTGECYRDPVRARGIVAALDDKLAELAREGDC